MLLTNESHIAGFSKLVRAVCDQEGKIEAELYHPVILAVGYMREQNKEEFVPSLVAVNAFMHSLCSFNRICLLFMTWL